MVAVTFDDSTPQLLKTAASLANRLGKPLHVVHCSEYWVGRSWPSNGLVPGDFSHVTAALEEESLKQAKSHLTELVKKTVPQCQSAVTVELGFPVDVIRGAAEKFDASIIVLGSKEATFRLMPRGLSTVMSLQQSPPCPVVVFPLGKEYNWEKNVRLKIGLADDLSQETSDVISRGIEFASILKNCEVHQVHCNGLHKDDLKAALTLVSATAHTPETALSSEAIWDATMEKITDSMKKRSKNVGADQLLQDGSIIKHTILHGNPPEEMLEYASKNGLDLLIFGRHKMLHHKPFTLGRMPFSAMAKMERPILVFDVGQN